MQFSRCCLQCPVPNLLHATSLSDANASKAQTAARSHGLTFRTPNITHFRRFEVTTSWFTGVVYHFPTLPVVSNQPSTTPFALLYMTGLKRRYEGINLPLDGVRIMQPLLHPGRDA